MNKCGISVPTDTPRAAGPHPADTPKHIVSIPAIPWMKAVEHGLQAHKIADALGAAVLFHRLVGLDFPAHRRIPPPAQWPTLADFADFSSPQKVHTHATSRLGGIGIASGILAGTTVLAWQGELPADVIWLMAACTLPTLAAGLAEDVTESVAPGCACLPPCCPACSARGC